MAAAENTEITVNSDNFEETILKSKLPAMVDFFADWCGPCAQFRPVLEKFSEEHQGKILVATVNIDKNADLAAKYNVMSIPTLIFFKDGAELTRTTGFMPLDELERIANEQFGGL